MKKSYIKRVAAVLLALSMLCLAGCSGSGFHHTFSDKDPGAAAAVTAK